MISTIPLFYFSSPSLKKQSRLFCALIFCLLQACSGTGYHLQGHESSKPIYYRVRTGDTLTQIADNHSVPLDSLVWLNGLNPYKALTSGELILVSYGTSIYHAEEHVDSKNNQQVAVKNAGARARLGTKKELALDRPEYVSSKLFWPAAAGKLVSGFGPRHGNFHDGIDIAAKTGTAVLAASSGEVIYSSSGLKGYGKLIIVRDDNATLTVYAHNSRLLSRVGQRVSRGQKIAEVGSTGRSSGPHLHFEVRVKHPKKGYLAVDPLAFFRKETAPVKYRKNEKLTPLVSK